MFASASVRMVSVIAALNRDLDSDSPTPANAGLRAREYRVVGLGQLGRAGGIEPMFRAANETLRLTRLPQLATQLVVVAADELGSR